MCYVFKNITRRNPQILKYLQLCVLRFFWKFHLILPHSITNFAAIGIYFVKNIAISESVLLTVVSRVAMLPFASSLDHQTNIYL